jgi:hypothetical protein
MSDNLYTGGGGGGFGELAGFGASELAKMWTNRALLSPHQVAAAKAQGSWPGNFLFGKGRHLRAAQLAESKSIWGEFMGASGGPMKRFRMARAGVEGRMLKSHAARNTGAMLSPYNSSPVTGALKPGTKQTYLKALTKGSLGRTTAGLLNPIARFGSAYYMWGAMIPMAAEGLIGGFNELARLGMQLDRGMPETAVGYRDMATKERAFTMRQSSLMAIHMSQTGIRAALGDEASFLHG